MKVPIRSEPGDVFHAIDKAKSLGAEAVLGGIAWIWARGIPKDNAPKFIEWLESYHRDHRGIYPSSKSDELRDVRFR